GNGGTGLLIHDETGSTRKIEIGQLSGNAKGLDVMAKGVTLRNLDVDNNHSGGVFFKVTNGSIEFSNVRHNGLVGILVQKSDGEIDGGSTVTDNRVDANGGDGIHIESNLNLVRHNVVKTSKGDGIQLATGATSNTLLKNAVRDSRHDGIDNWGTNTMMTDNVAQNSVGADIADIGDGNGTVAVGSSGNVTTDASNLSTKQELELDTLAAP
ncbi:MAG TPA: right-handed parallel beta-helix repeat-containing protein, partial [Planctomycetota bacterium]|nr:right-handed parallel beta-helix repeat-containing protein [Planctomycetota bacterium]